MNLRVIVIILSLLILSYTAVGGYIHFSSMRDSAFESALRRASTQAEMIGSQFAMFLARNQKPVRTMARLPEMRLALSSPGQAELAEANALLDLFQTTLEVDVCYLMNKDGLTIASSNRLDPDSFVGKNFGFRPYFKQAAAGRSWTYMALGTTSKKRGVYYSHPVEGPDGPIGVVVIKGSVDPLEKEYIAPHEGAVYVVDPHGVVFMSNRPDTLFRSIWPLSDKALASLGQSRQFGKGPWEWSGFVRTSPNRVKDSQGAEHLAHEIDLKRFPGWKLVYMRNLDQISEQALGPVVRTTGLAVLVLFLITTLSVSLLNAKANREIRLRKAAERELRESRERYRSLYHQTPALLHSIDAQGRFVSVSQYWLDTMGYQAHEVVGRELTDLMSPESGALARKDALPRFFRTGTVKDTPYLFRKKNGEYIDVLLSAIAERDEDGNIVRSLAVLVDITERKRAEQQLRRAKEELKQHSEDLERQVHERTKEITRLSGAIMTGQEAERAAIARELHDELGQVMTALSLDAAWLKERLKNGDPEAAARTRAMGDLIDSTISDIRSIATRLRPAVLDDLGLLDALEWYSTDFEKRTGVACFFNHFGVGRISGPKATAAYRIAQEALTNVARHAQAANVELNLSAGQDFVTLSVVDDGVGFVPTAIKDGQGLGLAGMRERASLVGGSLSVCSEPGRGVTVTLSMPL